MFLNINIRENVSDSAAFIYLFTFFVNAHKAYDLHDFDYEYERLLGTVLHALQERVAKLK